MKTAKELNEQIRKANDLPRVKITNIPEWGITPECPIYVGTLLGTERDDFETAVMSNGDGKSNYRNVTARLLSKCLQDEAGSRIFTDEEIAALGAKSCRILNRLYSIAMRLNGVTKADVEELEKNSASGQSAASGSA